MLYFSFLNQSFYHKEVHDVMPDDVVEISEAQHNELLKAVNDGAKIKRDLTIALPPSAAHTWQPETQEWVLDKKAAKQMFQAAQAAKIQTLNQTAQAFIAQAAGTDKVPEFELQSWNLQAIEAKAWAQNSETPTPILDEIAAARGVPPEMLKQAALRKTLAYEKLTAHVVGERQALQTRIETAKNLDELNAIDITFTLPEMGAA